MLSFKKRYFYMHFLTSLRDNCDLAIQRSEVESSRSFYISLRFFFFPCICGKYSISSKIKIIENTTDQTDTLTAKQTLIISITESLGHASDAKHKE